jgi:hypothetical protein
VFGPLLVLNNEVTEALTLRRGNNDVVHRRLLLILGRNPAVDPPIPIGS